MDEAAFSAAQRAAMVALGESCGWSMGNLTRGDRVAFCTQHGITAVRSAAPAAVRPHSLLHVATPFGRGLYAHADRGGGDAWLCERRCKHPQQSPSTRPID